MMIDRFIIIYVLLVRWFHYVTFIKEILVKIIQPQTHTLNARKKKQ